MEDPGRVVVAMSGGVDSSLAALLLAEAGWEVTGVTLQLRDGADERGSGDGVASARQAVEAAGGTHRLVDARSEFTDLVIRDFAAEYASGRTPNPCVRCNERLKWVILQREARAIGADRIATGHYARIGRGAQGPVLQTARDRARDQSYVLWRLGRPALVSTLFPLGGMTKKEVVDTARRFGLAAAGHKESQDICFVDCEGYDAFLDRIGPELEDSRLASDLRRALEPGEIVDHRGEVLGTHRGIARYTIGQRHGLGLAAGRPLYVTAIDRATGRLVVGEAAALERTDLRAGEANWISIPPPSEPFEAEVRIRYRGPRIRALILPGNGADFTARFATRQRAVTPGQSAVLYDGEIVLGGGIITD